MATFPSKVNYVTGDVLTATNMNDIGGAINLLQSAQYAAGKNKIINGDFFINQRSFSSSTTDAVFTYDRFGVRLVGDGTATVSAQTFTPGTAPVAGYEAANYIRFVTTGQTTAAVRTVLRQTIENVRTYAGETVTLSFWAKAAAGTPKIGANLFQNFGSGGSGNVNSPAGTATISTSWARYTLTVAIPSISGKTIGTSSGLGVDLAVSAGSTYNTEFSSMGIQTGTFDIWGIQVESGSTATPFQTATGNYQGELALCQRYFQRVINSATNSNERLCTGNATGIGAAEFTYRFVTTMRAAPTFGASAVGTYILINAAGGSAGSPGTIGAGVLSPNMARVDISGGAGLIAGNATVLQSTGASATMDFSAEF
jgi:hypothetical protein